MSDKTTELYTDNRSLIKTNIGDWNIFIGREEQLLIKHHPSHRAYISHLISNPETSFARFIVWYLGELEIHLDKSLVCGRDPTISIWDRFNYVYSTKNENLSYINEKKMINNKRQN